MENIATECQIFGEAAIKKMAAETRTRIALNPDSMENEKTLERGDIGRLVVGKGKEK